MNKELGVSSVFFKIGGISTGNMVHLNGKFYYIVRKENNNILCFIMFKSFLEEHPPFHIFDSNEKVNLVIPQLAVKK